MCRDFLPDPLTSSDLEALTNAALGAPAAGNTWALDLLVLQAESVTRYWDTALPPDRRDQFPWPGLLNAPLLLVPVVDPDAYAERYSAPDKERTGLGGSTLNWPVPYWWVDGGAAVMAVLAAAHGRELGALFFGQFEHESAISAEFGIPEGRRALGTIAIGRPRPGGSSVSRSAQRGRPDAATHVHFGHW